MSALNAVVAIHQKHGEEPGITLYRITEILRSGVGAEAGFDYQAGLTICERFPGILAPVHREADSTTTRVQVLRRTMAFIIRDERPRWSKSIVFGRAVVGRSVNEDNTRQCFASAHLFDDEEAAFDWWDSLASDFRQDSDDRKLEVGREGERLTLAHEADRLKRAGSTLEPKWPGREDAMIGYDIASFGLLDGAYQDIYIEAKACSSKPRVFHVTRNEWKIAMQRPERYLFYLWTLPTRELEVIKPAALVAHMPDNKGKGEWENAEIKWMLYE